MVETAVALLSTDESNTAQFGGVTWTDQTEERLAGERYPENVNFAPAQLQVAAGTVPREEGAHQHTGPVPTAMSSDDALVFRTIGPVPKARRQPLFHALQEWEGEVLETAEDYFISRLTDLTAGITATAGAYEEAEIPFSEISQNDLLKLRVGSIFRWVIGYERSASGTKKRVSQIVFRDLPVMTEQDVTMGEEWAQRILKGIQD